MFNDIYEIRDIGTKTRFFFIGDKTDADFKPDKSLPSYTIKLIPHMISDTDTVSVIKKKIMAFARKDITHHQMSLWVEFEPESVPSLTVSRIIMGHGEKNITKGNYLKIENGVLKKYKASLGYGLQNSNKIMVIDPDPMTLPDTVSPEIIKPFTTRDNNHHVLGSLPKIKQENGVYVINFLDHDNYLKQGSASPEKNLVVLDYYFNGHKNTSIEDEAVKMIQSQTEKILTSKSSILNELKEAYNKNSETTVIHNDSDRVNNLVLAFNRPYSYYLDDNMEFNSENKLNLSEIFKRFTVADDIPFVKYKDLDRKISYKIDTQSLITRETDRGIDDFLKITRDNTNPESFFQPFDYGKLEPVLKKREMLGWSVDKVLYRERQVRINERAEIELPIPGDAEMITFKMKLSTSKYALMKFDYCDVILKRDGSITVKFLDLNNKIVIGENDQLSKELKLVKHNIKSRIIPLISNKYNLDIESYFKNTNLPVVSVENVFDVMTDTTKEEKTIPLIQWIIKNKFSEYFTYRLNKKRPNNIYLKYHRVNNFENFENIRNYFLKMKELSVGVQQFKEEWVERSKNLFRVLESQVFLPGFLGRELGLMEVALANPKAEQTV